MSTLEKVQWTKGFLRAALAMKYILVTGTAPSDRFVPQRGSVSRRNACIAYMPSMGFRVGWPAASDFAWCRRHSLRPWQGDHLLVNRCPPQGIPSALVRSCEASFGARLCCSKIRGDLLRHKASQACGWRVTAIKLDPYLNVDASTTDSRGEVSGSLPFPPSFAASLSETCMRAFVYTHTHTSPLAHGRHVLVAPNAATAVCFLQKRAAGGVRSAADVRFGSDDGAAGFCSKRRGRGGLRLGELRALPRHQPPIGQAPACIPGPEYPRMPCRVVASTPSALRPECMPTPAG